MNICDTGTEYLQTKPWFSIASIHERVLLGKHNIGGLGLTM